MAIFDIKKILGGGMRERPEKKSTPPPKEKGPFEKRGSIPRLKFPELFRRGSYSIPWSRGRSKGQLRKMGKEILKERFPNYYGGDISGSEIQREIYKLKRTVPKTGTERNELREQIARLEDAKKRAGL